MTIVGAVIRPQLPPLRMLEVARAAEAGGVDEVWLWEDCFREGGIASAAAILGATSRIRVGIGVMPFPLRNVGLAAMEIATLAGMFPGRFLPGFGHGVQSWMQQVGARPRSVLTLEREYVTALRALLAGETVSVSGDYVRLDGVGLDWAPSAVPTLHLAATGPRSIELAGEIGDGVILETATPLDHLPRALELLDTGAERADRPRPEVVTFVPLETGAAASATAATAATALVSSWADAGADRVILQPAGDDPDPEAFVALVGSLA